MPFYPEEFTEINVDLKIDGAAILLTPLDEAATAMLQQILDAGPDMLQWHSNGVRCNNKDRVIASFFFCGGSHYRREEVGPEGGGLSTSDYEGSIKIHLNLENVQDETAPNVIRKYAWFAGIVVDSEASTAQQFRLLANGRCKRCDGPLVRNFELEWKVCDACAETCEHEYTDGIGQIEGHLAYGRFCGSCGRGHPDWKAAAEPMDDILNALDKGGMAGIILKHPDGSVTSLTKQ